jgi:hypothetical protein
MRGCCADEATAKYFSLDTGRLVASSTMPLLQIQVIDIKENRTRFVGAESNVAASPQASAKAMATLFFGGNEAFWRRFRFRAMKRMAAKTGE